MNQRKEARIELSTRDILYFLFSKKTCPICGGKLTRQSEIISVKNTTTGYFDERDGFNDDNENSKIILWQTKVPTEIKNYRLNYFCPNCKKSFPISELSKKKSK